MHLFTYKKYWLEGDIQQPAVLPRDAWVCLFSGYKHSLSPESYPSIKVYIKSKLIKICDPA